MSLPPGFLDELRARTSLTQVVGRKVIWDPRKSNQAKGDMWAPCPFHQEKTASFHVDDRKGFYHCFGCQASGDAIKFVRETENVGFMEAVEILAREAGLPMPARDPKAQARAEKRDLLAEVMEMAVRHYRMQLQTGAGQGARRYLAQARQLDEAALERFEIGYAPPGWQGLADALKAKDVPEEKLLEAGLVARKEGGRSAYDRFRDRIMFPIRDARGRCIGFGGRAMDPNDNAKYLNSPEGPLFDKGRSLYNHGPAREAAGKGQPLIVAEGYMDVIALDRAGFTGAVAPLGTAVTEGQLELLWRIAPEPIVALDGDQAGLRAAMRLIDVALPLLQAGRSLRFVLLPPGQDPDDLIKAQGPQAMQALLDGARPLVDLLWQRETEGQSFDSPERRAALDKRLRQLIGTITDPGLRQHYGQAIKDLRWQLFRPAPKSGGWKSGGAWTGAKGKAPMAIKPTAETKGRAPREHLRELAIVAVVLRNPALLLSEADMLEDLRLGDPDCQALLRAALGSDPTACGALPVQVAQAAGRGRLDALLNHPHLAVNPVIRRPGSIEAATAFLHEELAKYRAALGSREELSEAVDGIHRAVNRMKETGQEPARDSMKWRLHEARMAENQARRGQMEENGSFELAENGVPLDRDERAAFRALLDQLDSDESKKLE